MSRRDNSFRPLEPAKTSSFDAKTTTSIQFSQSHNEGINSADNESLSEMNQNNSALSLEESGYYSGAHTDSPFYNLPISCDSHHHRAFSNQVDHVAFSLDSSSQVDEDESELQIFSDHEESASIFGHHGHSRSAFNASSPIGMSSYSFANSRFRADSPSFYRHASTQTQQLASSRLLMSMRPNSAPIDYFEEIQEESEADVAMEGEVFPFFLDENDENDSVFPANMPDIVVETSVGRSNPHGSSNEPRMRARLNTTGHNLNNTVNSARRSNTRSQSVPSLLTQEQIMERVGYQLRELGDGIYSGRLSLSSSSGAPITSHSAESHPTRRRFSINLEYFVSSSLVSSSLEIYGRYSGINNSAIDNAKSSPSSKNAK